MAQIRSLCAMLTPRVYRSKTLRRRVRLSDSHFRALDLTIEPLLSTVYARPYLHEMLGQIAPYYDIIIWSQTSWRWLETKLVQLRIIGDERKGAIRVSSAEWHVLSYAI